MNIVNKVFGIKTNPAEVKVEVLRQPNDVPVARMEGRVERLEKSLAKAKTPERKAKLEAELKFLKKKIYIEQLAEEEANK